jgi:hypothetical protein
MIKMPPQQPTTDSGILSGIIFWGSKVGLGRLEMSHCREGIVEGFEQFGKTSQLERLADARWNTCQHHFAASIARNPALDMYSNPSMSMTSLYFPPSFAASRACASCGAVALSTRPLTVIISQCLNS